MTDERQSGLLFESWLKGTDPTPPEAGRSVARVMARVPQVRQRGRWWPLPVFDRPVSTLLGHKLAPAPTPDTSGREPARGFTMFSALKFVVAGVIVALFGGFLMLGMLSTQQGDEGAPASVSASPTSEATSEPTEADTTSVRSDILPGVALTVEEVEPGVFHVINDGVRDLHSGRKTDIVAGHDDGIWLLRKNQFFRLGDDDTRTWPSKGRPHRMDFEVTPDGTVWVLAGRTRDGGRLGVLVSSEGEGWTDSESPSGEVWSVDLALDGTVWAWWQDGWGQDGWKVGHLGPTGWQLLDIEEQQVAERLFFTDHGDLYAVACSGWGGCWLNHYEDGDWNGFTSGGIRADVGPDGTVWFLGRLGAARDYLARFVDGEWETWTERDDMGLGIALGDEPNFGDDGEFVVAPDSSLWASLWQSDDHSAPQGGLWGWDERTSAVENGRAICDGLTRFDGETADRFLPGRCITMDIAADGSVWVLAEEDEGKDLYVITPEAVAAGT